MSDNKEPVYIKDLFEDDFINLWIEYLKNTSDTQILSFLEATGKAFNQNKSEEELIAIIDKFREEKDYPYFLSTSIKFTFDEYIHQKNHHIGLIKEINETESSILRFWESQDFKNCNLLETFKEQKIFNDYIFADKSLEISECPINIQLNLKSLILPIFEKIAINIFQEEINEYQDDDKPINISKYDYVRTQVITNILAETYYFTLDYSQEILLHFHQSLNDSYNLINIKKNTPSSVPVLGVDVEKSLKKYKFPDESSELQSIIIDPKTKFFYKRLTTYNDGKPDARDNYKPKEAQKILNTHTKEEILKYDSFVDSIRKKFEDFDKEHQSYKCLEEAYEHCKKTIRAKDEQRKFQTIKTFIDKMEKRTIVLAMFIVENGYKIAPSSLKTEFKKYYKKSAK